MIVFTIVTIKFIERVNILVSTMVTLLVITTLTTLLIATLQSNLTFYYSINQVVITNSYHTIGDNSEPIINILSTLKTLSLLPNPYIL